MKFLARLFGVVFFICLLIGIGYADIILTGETLPSTNQLDFSFLSKIFPQKTPDEIFVPNGLNIPDQPVPDSDSSSSTEKVQKKTTTDLQSNLEQFGFVLEENQQPALLKQLLPESQQINNKILIKNNDRAGSVAWLTDPEIKNILNLLKDSLHQSFSSELEYLNDETIKAPDRPVVNVLSFKDPAIDEEDITIIRVLDLLIEFHISPGHEGEIDELIDFITK